MNSISVEALSSASPDRVWPLLADVSSWAEWSSFDESGLESEGSPQPDGVGAVRRFRYRKRTTRERVVEFEPPRRLSYELLSGLPINDYRAEVTLLPQADGGTLISWESRFESKFPIPGFVARGMIRTFVRDTAEALAKAAETDG